MFRIIVTAAEAFRNDKTGLVVGATALSSELSWSNSQHTKTDIIWIAIHGSLAQFSSILPQ